MDTIRAQGAAEELQARFLEAVLQQMPSGVIVAEAPSGRLILGNSQVERIWRKPFLRAAGIGDYAGYQGFHPDGRAYRADEWPMARAITNGESIEDEEIAFLRGDGTPGVMQVSAAPIRAADNRIVAGVVVFDDVTERRRAAEALRGSETRFRAIFDHAAIGIALFDLAGDLLLANPATEQILGYEQAELRRLGIPAISYPHDLEASRGQFGALARGEIEHVRSEKRFIHRDGRIVRAAVINSVIRSGDGQPVAVLGMLEDITEAGRARDAQRFLVEASRVLASSLDYETTLRRVADLAVPDLADWCTVYLTAENNEINQVALAARDPAKAELLQSLWQVHLRRRPENLGSLVRRAIASGEPQIVPDYSDEVLKRSAHSPEHLELLRRLGARSRIAVPLIARGRILGGLVLAYAESGRRYGSDDLALAEELARRCAVAIDNALLYSAERKARDLAERAAERTRRLQRITAGLSAALTPDEVAEVITVEGTAALGALTSVVARLSEDGSELVIVRSLGYPNEVIAPVRHLPIGAAAPAAEAVRTGAAVWVGSPEELDTRYPGISRLSTMALSRAWAVIPLVSEGRVLGGLSLSWAEPRAFDPDEQAFVETLGQLCSQALERARLYEEARAAVRARDEFLSIAAHELKTPLTALQGSVQLLARLFDSSRPLDPLKLRARVEVVNERSHKLGQLIGQLLDVSRVEMGKLKLSPKQTDLVSLAEHVASAAREQTDQHPVVVRSNGAVVATVDPLRLEQVLANLLDNAIKFSPAGGAIELLVCNRPGGEAEISVRDRGVGIPAERRQHIFGRYYQAHATDHLSGLGLGLYISREIVALHRGSLEAEFPEDGGTRFVIRIPAPL